MALSAEFVRQAFTSPVTLGVMLGLVLFLPRAAASLLGFFGALRLMLARVRNPRGHRLISRAPARAD